MKRMIYLLLVLFSLTTCTKENSSLFVEAETFEDKGGWLVDPQFVEQMGSPYLLAHGLGIPVENAKTKIQLANKGNYHVWVRTMNWAPGKWKAPGIFHLVINNNEISEDLGTETGWNWQYVGEFDFPKKENTIELKDLTGFEGRCDAIYFSPNKRTLPNNAEELAIWRKKELNETDVPEQSQNFDLVIVGGGIAGCAAAISAAEQGLTIALVHDRPVLGGNASSEIRVHTLGITWHYERILSMLNTEHYPNGSPKAIQEDAKRLSNLKKYTNISLYLNCRAYSANSINDSITSVDARNTITNKTVRFTAPYFIDCTGDGWIGYWAGAD
jgi:hypothetical protein